MEISRDATNDFPGSGWVYWSLSFQLQWTDDDCCIRSCYFILFFLLDEKDGRNERFRRGVELLEGGSFFEISLDGVISLGPH